MRSVVMFEALFQPADNAIDGWPAVLAVTYLPDGRAMLNIFAPSDVPRPDRAPKYRVASL